MIFLLMEFKPDNMAFDKKPGTIKTKDILFRHSIIAYTVGLVIAITK